MTAPLRSAYKVSYRLFFIFSLALKCLRGFSAPFLSDFSRHSVRR